MARILKKKSRITVIYYCILKIHLHNKIGSVLFLTQELGGLCTRRKKNQKRRLCSIVFFSTNNEKLNFSARLGLFFILPPLHRPVFRNLKNRQNNQLPEMKLRRFS